MKKIMSIVFFSLVGSLFSLSDEQLFTNIYQKQTWKSKGSISGPGSDIESTERVRDALPALFAEFDIKTMVDAPCGDFWWMQLTNITNLNHYIGIDIVKPLIEDNITRYSAGNISFCHMDIIQSVVPQVDLIMCRDLFLHIPSDMVKKVIRNFKASGSTYLLATTYSNCKYNTDRYHSNYTFRPLNLEIQPFNLPKPIRYIFEKEENRVEWYRYLALWRLEDIEV